MFFFKKIIYLFFHVWLCWAFDAARELSAVERSRADSRCGAPLVGQGL